MSRLRRLFFAWRHGVDTFRSGGVWTPAELRFLLGDGDGPWL